MPMAVKCAVLEVGLEKEESWTLFPNKSLSHSLETQRLAACKGLLVFGGLWRVHFPPVLNRTDRRLLV